MTNPSTVRQLHKMKQLACLVTENRPTKLVPKPLATRSTGSEHIREMEALQHEDTLEGRETYYGYRDSNSILKADNHVPYLSISVSSRFRLIMYVLNQACGIPL
jgi:hypothetical protein